MPIWFDLAGLVVGSFMMGGAMKSGRWGVLTLGFLIFGLACIGIVIKLL